MIDFIETIQNRLLYRDLNKRANAIKKRNYDDLIKIMIHIVRESELNETGLLQSDNYCRQIAEARFAEGKRNGLIDCMNEVVTGG